MTAKTLTVELLTGKSKGKAKVVKPADVKMVQKSMLRQMIPSGRQPSVKSSNDAVPEENKDLVEEDAAALAAALMDSDED